MQAHKSNKGPRQRWKLVQRWPNVDTVVPTLGQRWPNLTLPCGVNLTFREKVPDIGAVLQNVIKVRKLIT